MPRTSKTTRTARLLQLSAATLLACSSAHAADSYSIIDLGSWGGQVNTAAGINKFNQVIGTFTQPDGLTSAFFRDADGRISTQYETPGVGATSVGKAINDLGEAITNEGLFAAYAGAKFFPGSIYGVSAAGLNNHSQFTGNAQFPGNIYGHPFIYSANDGSLVDIGSLEPDVNQVHGNGTGADMNDLGQVVGASMAPPNNDGQHFHAFLYSNGQMIDIGTFTGAGSSSASSINNAGQVVGQAEERAFLYSQGTLTDLGVLAGWDSSVALDINNAGQIVGLSASGLQSHAFVYADGVMQDLNALLLPDDAGWTVTTANAINDQGVIVGSGTINGVSHAIMVIPNAVPEPGTSALLALGLAGVALARRKRPN